MRYRQEKVSSLMKKIAGQFIQEEAGPGSLITVTGANYNEKSNYITIFISVFPAVQEQSALKFVERKIKNFKELIRERAKIRAIPTVKFAIDLGEKNRERINEISNT